MTVGYSHLKKSGKSIYKHVSEYKSCNNDIVYVCFGNKTSKFSDEREAGRFVDLTLIKQGKEPVNILKRK